MRNTSFRTFSSLLFAFIVIVIGKYVIIAQNPITGEWKADVRSEKQANDGKIHLSFERRTDTGKHQNGSSYEYTELQGLTREQAMSGGNVRFSLVREAGVIECEGAFANGKGSGTFRFTPSSAYIGAMRSRGFDFEKATGKHSDIDGRLFTAALLNVTTTLADDLNSANFGKLEVDDLFKAAIFKVDSRFMAEMKATGFPNLGMEELVKARIFKIDADFVRQMAGMGFGTGDFENLVKYSIFKVTPEFVNELKAAGFNDLKSEEVVKFRIFNVTPALLNDLKAEGFTNLSAEEVVKFRIFNIDREFIRKAKTEDPNITVEELVKMRIGVRRIKGTI